MAAAKAALEAVAEDAGLSFEELLQGASEYVEEGQHMCEGDRWDGFSVPDDFWEHYEVYTGKRPDRDWLGNFFSCSC